MNWKELFKRYDELKELSDEELDSLLGGYWAANFKAIKREREIWKPSEKEKAAEEKEQSSCGEDYCEF